MQNLLNILAISPDPAGGFKPYMILLPFALILFFSKLFAIVLKKIKVPQVIGYLVAGILLGAITLIPNQPIFTTSVMEGISDFAKIGVIIIMFSAGLGTDIKKIKETGKSALVITSLGVIFPLIFGFGVAMGFLNTLVFTPTGFSITGLFSCLFYGVLLTATSVSVTVTVLKELGKLDSKVGACLISAAVLDDIIGIILLSLIVSLSKTGTGDSGLPFGIDWVNIVVLIIFMVGFFAICFLLWKPINKLFSWLNKKWPNHRRIPVFGFALAFLLAWAAEYCFGVADITGAFMAGLLISETGSRDYIDSKADSEAGIIFGPIFFASIGMMLFTTPITFNSEFWEYAMFGIAFVIVGLLGKVVGAGLGGLITKFNLKDSAKLGVGMMARAEVLIVCAKKGIDENMIDPRIMFFILLLIILSSILTPIILKLLYKKEIEEEKLLINHP